MKQLLKNMIGSGLNFVRCDGCGNTLWGEKYIQVYTQLPLPKLHHIWGCTCWRYCSKCNPEIHIVDSLIQRTYQRHGDELLCVDCGREHPANVCYKEMSEEEVRENGSGFPMRLEAGEAKTLSLQFAIPKEVFHKATSKKR